MLWRPARLAGPGGAEIEIRSDICLMTSSMYAAVAGLKAHMSALGVVGNNVANVNTAAYKSSRYTFSEELYTSVHSGSDGTDLKGGTNPAQIGFGCSIGTIDLDMSSKNYSPSGLATDCMIDGDGFFIVGDKGKVLLNEEQLHGMKLTRLGNFNFDSQGYLVDGEGNVVYGFARISATTEDGTQFTTIGNSDNPEIAKVLTEIRKPMCIKRISKITVNGEEKLDVKYEIKYPTYNKTTGKVDDYQLTADELKEVQEGKAEYERVEIQTISVDRASGRITGITSDETMVTVGYLALAQVDNPNGLTHDDHYFQALDGAGKVHVNSVGGSVVHIPEKNPQGGGNNTNNDTYSISNLMVGSAGTTEIINGGLESSGTDLATEITNMILLQRGYQANTRIITVTDSMLEELVNMKR